MRRALLAVSASLLLSGCFRHNVVTPAASEPRPHRDSGVSFLGLTNVTANASECKYGVARVTTVMPFWGLMVYAVTFGLAAPQSAQYWCVAPPESDGSIPTTKETL